MDLGLFSKIVDELPPSTVVVPFFRGESLLYPQFIEAMQQLRKFDKIQLATNGDYLIKKNQQAILRTCSFISLSLHSFRWGPKQREFMFMKEANKLGLTTQVSILETLIPSKEKLAFIKTWQHYVDRVRIYVEHSHEGYGDTLFKIEDDGQPCLKPFNEMVVYWNGKVALCCHDWNNPQPLGDLNSQSVEEVWHGKYYEDTRSKHQNGRRREVPSCKICHQWKANYLPEGIIGELYPNCRSHDL